MSGFTLKERGLAEVEEVCEYKLVEAAAERELNKRELAEPKATRKRELALK